MGVPELQVLGGQILGVTPEQQQKAQRSVAHHATDAADCAELLAMLGLDTRVTAAEIAADAPGVPTYRGEGAQVRRKAQRATRAGSSRSAR